MNQYKNVIRSTLPHRMPKLTIEQIYSKTTNGFDDPVKTDVLGEVTHTKDGHSKNLTHTS
jgi:hypothetical protein